jgi:uncharacterized protein involved in exopolysaccharide biosynthesis
MDHPIEEGKIIPRHASANDAIEIVPPAHLHAWEQAPREPHLRDYWRILRKHQWLILTFLLTVVTAVTIATFKMRPVYEATARIEVDKETPNLLPFQNTDSYSAYEDLESYIETQSKVLQSETLALETIKSTGIASNPEFGGTPGGTVTVPSIAPDEPVVRPAFLGSFMSSLNVKRVPNSRLLDITFDSTDPKLAARVLNAHLQNFIDYNFRSRYEATTQASKWLQQQLDDYKIQVEKSEDARLAYERGNHIWELDEKQDITTQKLGDLNKELTDAQGDRMKKEADYRLASAGDVDSVPAVRDNILVQDLTRKETDLHQQYNDALSQYGPNFPKVMRLQEQVKTLDQFVANQKKDVVNRLEQEYRTAVQREQMITEALDRQKADANDMGEKMVQYNILKRDADANKQLYDGLLEKLKEAFGCSGCRSGHGSCGACQACPQPQYPAGHLCWAAGWHRSRFRARIYGQHRQDTR